MVETGNIIALATDFGVKDHYVGVMKGVMLSINRHAQIVDLTHDIDPADVMGAYFYLENSYRYFPDGTIFVAVVDPGVGTERAIIAVQSDRHLFLAPDNGILGFLEREAKIERIVRVKNRKYFLAPVSNTFHGRDVFAPVAAHLSLGVDLGDLGEETTEMARLHTPQPRVSREGVIVGEVVSIDRFGNLVTNIPAEKLKSADAVEIKMGKTIVRELSRAYGAKKAKGIVALIGSGGTIEIAVNKGHAAKKLGAKVGDIVRVTHSQK